MYKLVFFIPEEYKENMKKSLFEAGAGKYENYDMCSFEVKGTGQFRPLTGSDPFFGENRRIGDSGRVQDRNALFGWIYWECSGNTAERASLRGTGIWNIQGVW